MKENEKFLFLKGVVNNESAINELLLYSENKFNLEKNSSFEFSNASIKTWEEYYKESAEKGVFETLKKYLVQLQFPVQKGISKSEDYINSTLKGQKKKNISSLLLNQPELIELVIYKNSLIGKIPVIIIPDDKDFNLLICALSNKNEPQELPKSMGASFISGINNWDRIRRLKSNWLKSNQYGSWSLEFNEHILPNPHLFKDRLIVLSTKPYSGIEGDLIGVSKSDWKKSSVLIRLQHECAHLFTLKYYGQMANNMHDEIIADYAGIINVLPKFNKDWFLHFMGLEDYPRYRKGGRLENYQGHHEMSQEAFGGLQTLIKKVADNIYKFDHSLGKIKSSNDQLNRIKSVCETDLITMASSKGSQKLIEKYKSIKFTTI